MPSRKSGRKLVFVPSDIIDRLTELSNREGRPLSVFLAEILEEALKVYEDGGSVAEAVGSYRMISMQRSAGILFLPVSLVNILLSQLEPEKLKEALRSAYDAGYWYGRYITVKFDNPLSTVETFLSSILVSPMDLSIDKAEGSVKFKCIVPTLSSESTKLLVSMIEGIMAALGYRVKREEYTKGIAIIEFKRSSNG